jgi:hypothetical protein
MTEPKTKSLGTIDATKAKKIAGFESYTKAAAALMEARQQTTAAKTKVKQSIKKQLGHEADNLDFVVETNGSIRVYENLVEKTPRATSRTADLSNKF